MNNELTITLTGQKAEVYLNLTTKYNKLYNNYSKLEINHSNALHTIDKLTTEVNNLKTELKIEDTVKEIDKKYNASIKYEDNSEKDTTIAEVIESNPVVFPAITNNKPKSGTHWTEKELKVIKRALEANYTLAFLKVKLSNRSEAAIRSMLLNHDVGVKNNKLYAK